MSTHALHFRNKVQQATTVEDSLTALLHGIAEEIEARHASPKALTELASEIHDGADVLIEDVFDNIAPPVTTHGPGLGLIPEEKLRDLSAPQSLGAVAANATPKIKASEKVKV